MHINPRIFREYDIRGYVEKDLSESFAYVLGRAYAELCLDSKKAEIAIGWDCRPSSPGYAHALGKGIADGGVSVQLIGMGPTPQLYFSIFHGNLGGGIQVTGSHNPSDMNGFKMCLGTQTLSGEQIQDLKNRVLRLAEAAPEASERRGSVREVPLLAVYQDALIANCRPHMGQRKLKVVVDAGNGVGGMVGPAALRALGVEVIELFCEPDGTFPNHHPDPTVLENIEELISTVKSSGADFGIGWDGDADRIGVVDEKGQVMFGDMLLLLFARSILETVPNATVIGDVKCSQRLFDDLKKRGANPIMWKTGHSLIKGKLRETGAELAGEMSGHIFFKHRYYGFDDAIYASLRFAELVSKTNKPVSELLSDLPGAVSTPEIRVDCPEDIKFQIPERAKQVFSQYRVDTTDGVRIGFDDGWGLLRASNTQPVLVLRFEARTNDQLKQYQKIVEDGLQKIMGELAH